MGQCSGLANCSTAAIVAVQALAIKVNYRQSEAEAMQMTYSRLWIVANGLGFMLSLLLIFALGFVRPSGSGLSTVGWGLGLALGGMQALVLRRRLPQLKIWHWMVATGLGTYVGSILSALSYFLLFIVGPWILSLPLDFFSPFVDSMEESILLALMGGILLVGHVLSNGISVGVAQVLVLRRHTPNWWRWWKMSLLGFTLGGALVFYSAISAIDIFSDASASAIFLVIRGLCFSAIRGVIYGNITAIALKDFRPRQHEP